MISNRPIRFLSQELGKDFGHFSETILPPLVLLIPNSAKVMACSATVAIKFILQVGMALLTFA